MACRLLWLIRWLSGNLPANAGDAGDMGSIPELGRSPERGHSNPLQYSCLENPMGREAWWATVHGVTKSWTQLSDWAWAECILLYVYMLIYRDRDRARQKKEEGKGQRMWVCKPWGGYALESKWRAEYKEFSNYYLHKKSDTTSHSESAVRLAA